MFSEIEALEHILCDWETWDGIRKHVEGKLKNANIKIKIHWKDIILGLTETNNKRIMKDLIQIIEAK